MSCAEMLIRGCPGAERKAFLRWGDIGHGIVYTDAVPTGRAWVVVSAGGFKTDGNAAEYKMEHRVPVPGGYWHIPLVVNVGGVSGTPMLALHRSLVLLPGDMLSVRATAVTPGTKIGIGMTYWDVSVNDLLTTPAVVR